MPTPKKHRYRPTAVAMFFVAEPETLTVQNTTPKTTPKTTQERILEEIRKNPQISRNRLSEVVGITPDGIKYHLQKLTKSGIIRHVGSTRSGEWVISS